MATKRKKKRKVNKIAVLSVTLAAVVLLFAAAWAVVRFVPGINLLPVNKITVAGESVYSAEQIIESSKIKIGTSILKFSFEKTEKRIENNLPYIKDAKISYSLNGELKIKIKAEQSVYSIKHNGEYYLMNESFKLLSTQSTKKENTLLLHGIKLVEDNQPGRVAVDKNSKEIKLFFTVKKLLDEQGLSVNVIDLADENDIKLVYRDKFIVELGTDNYLEDKIKLFVQMAKDLTPDETGRILLKYWSDDNRQGSIINENIEEYLNNY